MGKKEDIKNISASVKQRLLNIAKEENREYQAVFKQYIQERMLYRISASKFSGAFILKGALLFFMYNISKLRPTKDIDFMGNDIGNDEEVMRNVFSEIVEIPSEDGLEYDPETIKTERIVEDGNYKGIRLNVVVKLGNAKDRLQIDIGFGDKIYAGPVEMDYPTLLALPAPRLFTYSIESAIAEKFEAIVSIGIATSRMKDFYDILFFAGSKNFQSVSLFEAIKLTFKNRNTELAARNNIFQKEFRTDKQKQIQWSAFLNKNKLEADKEFEIAVSKISTFIEPLFELKDTKTWNPGKWIWE